MIYTVTLNTAIDKIIEINGTISRKKNNKIKSIEYDVGGKGTHISILLSALNIPNVATGIIGSKNKKKLLNLLEKRNVICEFIEQENSSIRESLILIDDTQKGSIMITESGFIVERETLNKLNNYLQHRLSKDDFVVFSGSPPKSFPMEWYSSLIQTVMDKNAKLVMDVNGKILNEALIFSPYLIKPNEDEFLELIDKPLSNLNEYIEEITRLLNKKIKIVAVSLGKKGSLIGYKDKIYKVSPPAINEINDTGCGDIFLGGLLAGIYQKLPIKESIQMATALSATKAMQKNSSSFSITEANNLKKFVEIQEFSISEVG